MIVYEIVQSWTDDYNQCPFVMFVSRNHSYRLEGIRSLFAPYTAKEQIIRLGF